MSHNHLIDRLMEAVGATAEKVPKGWFTLDQYLQKSGKSPRTVAMTMAKGLKYGILERRKFRIFNEGHGCLYPTVHYREIKR